MSGRLHPATSTAGAGSSSSERPVPLLTPDQAAALLDHVIFEQVLECVDLDAVMAIEQSLTLMLGDVEGVPCERARELARSVLERAVRQLPDNVLGYSDLAEILSLDRCELCEDEHDEDRTLANGSSAPTDRRRRPAHRRR